MNETRDPATTGACFAFVVFHYPRPEHRAQLIERMTRAGAVMAEQPGFLDLRMWQEESSGAIVGDARWASKEAFVAALPVVGAAAGADMAYDIAQEARERDVYQWNEIWKRSARLGRIDA